MGPHVAEISIPINITNDGYGFDDLYIVIKKIKYFRHMVNNKIILSVMT